MSGRSQLVESDQPEPTYSDRGFAGWESVESTYEAEVSVYESSAAEGPHLWVNVNGECHLTGERRSVPGIPFGVADGSCSAHLTMEQARELRAKLDAAIEHSEHRFEEAS